MFSSFTDTCTHGPCYPGNEQCAAPHAGAPRFHLVDTRGCGLNDPNGPFWDPVHGVAHVFYQIHLAEKAVSTQGRGSDWGHFVSRDLVTWASMPVAIWNGLSLDEDAWPPRSTMYDTVAIFSGSALVVDGAGPGGKGDGVVMFYPGLCDTDDWPSCTQHDRDNEPVLLATAVPADYANDALLTNWSKPSYNPIWPAINHSGDPSTPWQMASGEWRIRTSDTVLGSASTSKLLSGEWYEIGQYDGFVDSNCPSLFPLPPPTPGTERAFEADRARGALPTHVQKTSACGIRPGAPPFHGCYDRWHVGTYDAATAPGKRGSFTPTPGWEDMFEHRLIDAVPSIVAVGNAAYYASKDGEFPPSVADGGKSRSNRRINFGYVLAPTPGQDLAQSGAHALPREVTFNALTRALQQAPLSEVAQLREAQPAFSRSRFDVEGGAYTLPLDAGVARQSELLVSFALPPSAPSDDAGDDADDESDAPITFGIAVAGVSGSALECTVTWAPRRQRRRWLSSGQPSKSTAAAASSHSSYEEHTASCGGTTQPLRLLPEERSVELRVFCDWTLVEVYFQGGRVVMTTPLLLGENATLSLLHRSNGRRGGGDVVERRGAGQADVVNATLWPMKPIMTTPEAVRAAPRVFP